MITSLRRSQILGPTALACFMAVTLPGPAQAQATNVQTQRLEAEPVVVTDTYFGTVRASDLVSLSYEARGCIVEISEDAKSARQVSAGQALVRLDDQRPLLAERTAAGRVDELAAAIEERELTLAAALADDRRRKEELDFVFEEFQRNSVMLGRGLINESTMEAIQRRYMDATFVSERAKEAIASAEAGLRRAQIALEIGMLDQQATAIDLEKLALIAPFDGVLVGFEANVGDCVQEGALAAQVYEPDRKSVDVFFPISRLSAPEATGLAIGSNVRVTRVNEQVCNGAITRLDTVADPETQFVEATVDVDTACAPDLFLNESVEVEAVRQVIEDAFSVPNSALLGNDHVYLVNEDNMTLMHVSIEVVTHGLEETVIRIPDGMGRLLVTSVRGSMTDGQEVSLAEAG